VGKYVLDFYCEEARLNIELDGSQHGFPSRREQDRERSSYLEHLGIKSVRFWNTHLRRNGQSVRDTIFVELQARAPHPVECGTPLSLKEPPGEKD
jgi:very-short-patch-repair endonuclease